MTCADCEKYKEALEVERRTYAAELMELYADSCGCLQNLEQSNASGQEFVSWLKNHELKIRHMITGVLSMMP